LRSLFLLITLFDELQLPQVMAVAQPVALILKLEIGSVVIVDWGYL
jgi:hypothetical protein